MSDRLRKIADAATHLGNTVDASDTIVKEEAVNRDGWGFVHRSLDNLTGRIAGNRPDGVTVNDFFLTPSAATRRKR
ncbi:MAG: hypothetical protein ACLFSW_03775 [Halobacteriales archaeon]